jgi:phosphoglycerate-specific signal transduction histidine kinase
MALFKLIKEFEIRLAELESKKPRTLLFKMIVDTQIRGLKCRIQELKDEVAERKKGSKLLDDGK